MQEIIERECKAANFFVERVYRASWNLSDQFISSIIEVGMLAAALGRRRTG